MLKINTICEFIIEDSSYDEVITNAVSIRDIASYGEAFFIDSGNNVYPIRHVSVDSYNSNEITIYAADRGESFKYPIVGKGIVKGAYMDYASIYCMGFYLSYRPVIIEGTPENLPYIVAKRYEEYDKAKENENEKDFN